VTKVTSRRPFRAAPPEVVRADPSPYDTHKEDHWLRAVAGPAQMLPFPLAAHHSTRYKPFAHTWATVADRGDRSKPEGTIIPSAPRHVAATRYVAPLREGGSLPGLVEADDDGLYVVKFRGAGQGTKALVAELIVGELGRALGLPVPELVIAELDPALGRAEPDPEVQELLERSGGLNLGIDFLPGSLALGAPAAAGIDAELAADVVWFDAFATNVDRTPRNPNLLLWHRRLWLIDHGAALYQHHSWSAEPASLASLAAGRFPAIRQHVLLPVAGPLPAADERLAGRLTTETISAIVAALPDDWLVDQPPFPTPAGHRAAYVAYLSRRLAGPREWAEEAERARLASHAD